jgi:hypothetical protein
MQEKGAGKVSLKAERTCYARCLPECSLYNSREANGVWKLCRAGLPFFVSVGRLGGNRVASVPAPQLIFSVKIAKESKKVRAHFKALRNGSGI